MQRLRPSRLWFRRVVFVLLTGMALLGVLWALGSMPRALAHEADVPRTALTAAPRPEPAGTFPQPERDPCLHCHMSEGESGVWDPPIRWSVFGVAGLVFAFGMYRSTSLWRERGPWRPLRARAVEWIDERYDVLDPLGEILNKPVPLFATRWAYCLGGITFTLFVIQAVTGILLAFYYKPTPQAAYASIEYIMTEVRFGALIRSVHHWAANGMIITVVLHMVRVFVTGAYKPPRELNWIAGVLLLLITLGFGFTGYLLVWDQRAFWATTVGSDMVGAVPIVGELLLLMLRGGWTVTEATLGRFFAVHVMVLPIVIIGLMGAHFLMIRRQGIARPL